MFHYFSAADCFSPTFGLAYLWVTLLDKVMVWCGIQVGEKLASTWYWTRPLFCEAQCGQYWDLEKTESYKEKKHCKVTLDWLEYRTWLLASYLEPNVEQTRLLVSNFCVIQITIQGIVGDKEIELHGRHNRLATSKPAVGCVWTSLLYGGWNWKHNRLVILWS